MSSVLPYAQAEWHGELTFLSDYLYRGYSKNRGNPLAQAHIDYQDPMGWFGGVGVSQVSFDDRRYKNYADVEIKPYLGWSLPLNHDWRTELSVAGYLFDGKIFGKYADYAEFYASLHYQNWLTGTVSVAPNAYRRDATVMNYELKYRRDILDNLQFSAGLGYYQANKLLDEDYFYWNAGASWFISSNLALDMRYVDVNLNNHQEEPHHHEFYPRLQDNKFLISVTVGF
ncbi:TorF family putative porin [Methylomonas denitrificans]|uniref:TorF family putative porin n=1 Tax=Methylomonas denitrificans TaxID=1538553 RepID=UPI001E578396|nr:TorF family putative porin [Methylomonas denitrificans]